MFILLQQLLEWFNVTELRILLIRAFSFYLFMTLLSNYSYF